jgi:hypothetical protein
VGDDSRARVRRLTAAGALLLLAAGPTLALEPTRSALEELRQRGVRKITGTIEGRMYIERPKPDASDIALVGVGVLLVPRADDLLERLETAKRGARESMRGFREAAPTVRAAVDEHELQLWRAGFPDAAVRTSTDAAGVFRAELPAGAWVLVAERSVFVSLLSPRAGVAPSTSALDPLARYSTSAYQHFLPSAKLVGYDAVTVWLRELSVEAGQTVTLDLHDRGIWLSGVVEETDVPRRVRFAPGGRKR